MLRNASETFEKMKIDTNPKQISLQGWKKMILLLIVAIIPSAECPWSFAWKKKHIQFNFLFMF